jgi:hypothetical protein
MDDLFVVCRAPCAYSASTHSGLVTGFGGGFETLPTAVQVVTTWVRARPEHRGDSSGPRIIDVGGADPDGRVPPLSLSAVSLLMPSPGLTLPLNSNGASVNSLLHSQFIMARCFILKKQPTPPFDGMGDDPEGASPRTAASGEGCEQ